MAKKYVYLFGYSVNPKAIGACVTCSAARVLISPKCLSLGLPVPAGFTITTEVCTHYYDNKMSYPTQLSKQVEAAIVEVEKKMGAKFGDPKNPLLLSVRSGARVSMPGMMETVLNLGLNDEIVEGLVENRAIPLLLRCVSPLRPNTATSLWAFAPRVSRLIPSSS